MTNYTVGVSLGYFGSPVLQGRILDDSLVGSFFGYQPSEQERLRYTEITDEQTHSPFAPSQQTVADRICIPLNNAKRYYCKEEYISCISMSGMVCEMLTSLLYMAHNIPIDNADQYKRINFLTSRRIIGGSEKVDLHYVREVRNSYVHEFSYSHEKIKEDSMVVCRKTLMLFKSLLKMQIGSPPGFISFPSEILNILNS
jgi:hypothetical protein